MILTVARLGHLGDGIAEGPEGPVFVAGALPGEVVEGTPRDGRIAEPRILTPSPDRVRPPCRHARRCGGCGLQHASDGFLAAWKAEVVRTALAARGLEAPLTGVETSPPRSRRRAVLAGRRLKSGAIAGFHARGSATVVEVPDCQVLRPALRSVLPALAEVTALGASRKGEIDLALTETETGLDLAVSGGKDMDPALFEALAALADRAGIARIVWNGAPVVTTVAPQVRFGTAVVVPPPGGFLQATAEGEAALLAGVRAALGPARRIADLFAGAGTFALPLAAQAEVHAVEGDAEALAALDAGWRRAGGLHRVTTEARDLFRRPLLPDELSRFDAVVIDPPRAGAEAQATALARSAVPVLAQVSCNPASFARDARILAAAGFRIDWIRIVDQFRWSPHVELVARLSR